MDKEQALRKEKRIALYWLLGAFLVFVATSLAPRMVWVDFLRAMSEAAMVGGLADWFAVTVLFRKIPVYGFKGHTGVIPNNKDKIADNLAIFVEEKFLDARSLTELIRKHDPAQHIAIWMANPDNANILGSYMVRALSGVLAFTDDIKIRRFIQDAIHAAVSKIDLTQSLGSILDVLTKDGRHQVLLDHAIHRTVLLLNQEDTRTAIAGKMVEWLKQEYPVAEKVLPSHWIGEKSADTLADILDTLLTAVANDKQHALRKAFDKEVLALIVRLKEDAALHAKGEQIKQEILQGEAVGTYITGLWGSLRQWIKDDLARADSTLHAKTSAATQWIGRALLEDAQLRASLNHHMEQTISAIGPDFAQVLTRHISDTVKNWNANDLSHQIELNIGKDLQKIRINGTIVGGLIGAILFGLSSLLQQAGGLF